MSKFPRLDERATSQCELCSQPAQTVYSLKPAEGDSLDHTVLICETCSDLIANDVNANTTHWRSLSDAMWNEHTPVKVLVYSILEGLSVDWAAELKDSMYLTSEEQKWADRYSTEYNHNIVHKDSNGNVLQAGDNIALIKDLVVKGANMTAKRGTNVRNIRLVHDNADQIEGRVEGQMIVILTQYVKKV